MTELSLWYFEWLNVLNIKKQRREDNRRSKLENNKSTRHLLVLDEDIAFLSNDLNISMYGQADASTLSSWYGQNKDLFRVTCEMIRRTLRESHDL